MKEAPDQLVLNAVAVEAQLAEQISLLMKYRARITAMLAEMELTEPQRAMLQHVINCAEAALNPVPEVRPPRRRSIKEGHDDEH